MKRERTDNYWNGGPCVGCRATVITFSELYYLGSFEKNSLRNRVYEEALRLIHAAAGGRQDDTGE